MFGSHLEGREPGARLSDRVDISTTFVFFFFLALFVFLHPRMSPSSSGSLWNPAAVLGIAVPFEPSRGVSLSLLSPSQSGLA